MGKLRDLAGKRFGRWTVLERAGNRGKQVCWRCRCDCGTTRDVTAWSLTNGKSLSCGCLNKEIIRNIARENFTKHGMYRNKAYKKWKSIKNRCLNPHEKCYRNYGGRGVTICDEWRNSFISFYDYVSQLPNFGEEGYSLDRIDNSGNYEPGNIRWATRKEQGRNQRTNVIVDYNGKEITLKEAAELSGINYGTLWDRYKRGDRGERLFRPARKFNRK